MKTFEILDYGFESLPTENIDGKRYYITPTGEKYPSVTSVTGLLNRDGNDILLKTILSSILTTKFL